MHLPDLQSLVKNDNWHSYVLVIITTNRRLEDVFSTYEKEDKNEKK